jgi:membrane dipeptidase
MSELAIFDGHNDALTREGYVPLSRPGAGGHVDLGQMREGGMRGGIFAVFTPSPKRQGEPPAQVPHCEAAAFAAAAAGRLFALERDEALAVARGVADLDAARSGAGPPVAVLHLEGAEAIDPALEALEFWYAAGLRSLGPVWSRPNAFGYGVPFLFPGSPDHGPGLTAAGTALVRRCAELGVMVDLSHLNEAGFWDVARLEPGPLVASHSGAHGICPASRNLTDAQLDAIAASGGLVGIVFACKFLRADCIDDEDTPLTAIVAHARYIAERIGAEHVALGSDFDGATIPRELGGAAGLPRLVEALGAAGFCRGELEAICWGNWRRVLGAWWRG